VRETPFYKTSNYDDLRNYLITARYRDEAQKLISKVLSHVNQYLSVETYSHEAWFAPKVKLSTAHGDSRETQVKREGKLISVLCGKLDAAFAASDEIIGAIQ
jgi:hypothetical protein